MFIVHGAVATVPFSIDKVVVVCTLVQGCLTFHRCLTEEVHFETFIAFNDHSAYR